jgi:hypothetical protein
LVADSRGESFFVAAFSHTGREHRSDGKSLQEAVGKLVCEHMDLLEIPITVQDLATNVRR